MPEFQRELTSATGGRFDTAQLILAPALVAACVMVASALGARLAALAALAAVLVSLNQGLRLRNALRAQRSGQRLVDERFFQAQKLAALGELASGIAHEINTPLSIIGQETEWMEHLLADPSLAGSSKTPELRDSLQQINTQVSRSAEITHSILGFASKRAPISQKVDLNKLIDDMVRWIEREARLRNIEIVREYSQALPQIETDPPQLRQVVLNLLNNAYQAVDQRGTITVATRALGDASVAVEVRDTGCGIAPENMDKIFNPFFTTKPPGKGTGLGLSISFAIVNKLGGSLSAVSRPGECTVFTLTLPVKAPTSEERP